MIDYQAANNIERELREQYAVQEAEGKAYKRPKDLDTIFRGQAAKLAAQGVTSIYDIAPSSWTRRDGKVITNLINKNTGEVLVDVSLYGDWQNDPTSFRIKQTRNADGQVVNKPIELIDRNGYQQWGADTSVSDMARYGINFVDGTPVFTPVYKDTTNFTTSDAIKTAAAIAGAYYGGQYLLGGETAAAAPAAGAGGGSSTISLLEGAQFPVEGLKAAVSTAPSATAPFATAATPGLTVPTVPGLSAMGGAQGLTIPVAGGTISQLGLFPTGAVPALGTDGLFSTSLVNDPNVLGTPVFTTDAIALPTAAPTSSIGVTDALLAANLANTIFNPPKPQQQGLLGGRTQSQFSLPTPEPRIVGLLPTADIYRRSLL